MKLPGIVLLLACVTAASAAEPPRVRNLQSPASYAYKPDIADYYPATSRNLGEQGVVKVTLCYDDLGKPFQSSVAESSGFTRLDEAAVRWAKAVRIKPGAIDGQPQPGCVVIPARFSLRTSQQSPDRSEDVPPVQVPPVIVDTPHPPPPPPVRLIPLGESR